MQRTPTKFAAILIAALSVALGGCEGCRKGQGPTTKALGEIGVVFPGPDGADVIDTTAVYDFGVVFMGQKKALKLKVKNLGVGLLGLDTLEKKEGATVSIGDAPDPAAVFDVRFESVQLDSSMEREFDITFQPPTTDDKQVEYQVVLELRASNTDAGKETATITLKGKAVSGVCEVPLELDFGAVALGDSQQMTIELKNPTELDTIATVRDIRGTDRLAFSFADGSAHGTVPIPKGTSKKVVIAFTPTAAQSYLAIVDVRASEECPEFPVKLKGEGVDQVLTWSCGGAKPQECDFGYASPGISVQRQLKFMNAGNADVTISEIKSLLPGDYVPEVTSLVVSGKGESTLGLTFKPTALGPRETKLMFTTSLAKQQNPFVQLKGFGGGPDIQVNPSPTLNFGQVAFVGGTSYQIRKLTVMNVGTKPVGAGTEANLKLGANGAGQPYAAVTKVINGDASEIAIIDPPTSGPGSYNPSNGLEASAGKNLVDLNIKITPSSIGRKEFEVTVYSNDPDEPEVKILVTADAVMMPPCNYSVSPAVLDFGMVSPPDYRDLSFTIKNEGATDKCLLSGLDIKSGSDPVFTLPDGPIDSKELAPQETLQVMVRAWPQTSTSTLTQAVGAVRFFMSSNSQPEKEVSLKASLGTSCLNVFPDEEDFGTVQKGCNSSTKTFQITNACTNPVTVTGVSIQSAAGQPAGGPDCPGASPCPEFILTKAPFLPAGGQVLTQGQSADTFQVKYSPIDFGSDSGVVAVTAIQGGVNVTYLVTLSGKGDAVGLNTDTFVQDAKPKADILLVIDDSCSMSEEQASLASNFSSFIQYANAAGVDYHIGVTTTDMTSSGAHGRLISGPTHPEKVLTPLTPNVENKFKAKVNVGTSGSGSEEEFSPALAALTAPIVTNENAGFLRNDAVLAVVAITDEEEQSPQSDVFYYNAFMNIKGVKRASMFTFNAIAGFDPLPSGCTATRDDGSLEYMVTQTNGVKENICTPDWAKSLEQLGKTAFGFRTSFFLNAIPDLTGGKSIEVKVDGVVRDPVDPRTGATVWTYDGSSNSVNFDPLYVPEPGQTMTITYYVACF